MKNKQQPEALALASIFEIRVKMFGEPLDNPPASRAAKELRRLHARVEELEKDLGNAKCLVSKIWDKHPEARETIEEGTGAWLVFGQDVETGGVSAQRITQAPTLEVSSDWLIDGGLLYRLNDEGTNCDEINVTMAGGLRTEAARVERAGEILNMLKAVQQAEWTGTLRGEDCKHEVFDDGVKTMIPRNPAFVRITHIPTGVTVECRDDERSSHRNSANAWLMLEAKLKEKKKLDFSSAPAAMLRIKAIQKAADHIEREGFEAWWRENVSQGLAEIDHDYRYWAIWQARAALASDHIEHPPEMVAAPAALPEPDEYQYRMKPNWDDKLPWTPWEACCKESAANFRKRKEIHDWIYEVRERYTEQQVRELLAAHGITQKKRSNDKEEQQWQ